MTPPTSISSNINGLQTACAVKMYSDRASNYDSSTGGWHVEFGQDFARWIAPAPGSAVLDLACGTGLVTLPMAAAVGSSGVVVGIDITAGMLDLARQKELPDGAAEIEWVEADITEDVGDVEAVRRIGRDRGGFDIISCCSALVLLNDPTSLIKKWAALLKEDGRIIVDVPTEYPTLQYMFVVALRTKLGMALPFDRQWVQGMDSLESLYEGAGLVVEKSWKTKSYIPETWYENTESKSVEVFEQQTRELYVDFAKEDRLEDARIAWREVWNLGVEAGKGRVYEGHPLYVSIGRRPRGFR